MSRLLLAAAVAGLALWSHPLRAQEPPDTSGPGRGAATQTSYPDSVDVGYGKVPAARLTGAVARVGEDRFNPGRIVSSERLIQDRIAGVEVLDANEPGGTLAVRIRGTTSLAGGSDPLYVVDGMPLGTGTGGGLSDGRDPLNFLDPNDIASITVLKDAGAAAIYGIDAAAGVVLITTKSGRGAPHVEYSGSMSSTSATRLAAVLDAPQFRAAVAQYDTAGLAALDGAGTDWFGRVSRPAFGQEHDLALSGGGARDDYRLSLGYLRQDGAVLASSTERLSLGLSYRQRLLGDLLDLRVNLRGSRLYDRFTPGGVLSNAVRMGPTQPVYDAATATGYYDWPGLPPLAADNPVEIANLAQDHATDYRSVGNLRAALRMPFLTSLIAHANLGYDVTTISEDRYQPSLLDAQIQSTQGLNASAHPSLHNTVVEVYLRYAAPLAPLPGRVEVTAGYSHSHPYTRYRAVTETYLSSAAPPTDSLFAAQDLSLTSYFGRVRYSLADRYVATVSLRHDRSSAFAPAHASATFPAVVLAWHVAGEPFLRGMRALSDLDLRASWGRAGDQGSVGALAISPGTAIDPSLQPARTTSYDAGLDFGLFRRRLSGTVDWYTRTTTNVIATLPVLRLTTNVGSVRNRGLELSLDATLLDGGPRRFGWTAGFTASTNANEMLTVTPVGGSPILQVGSISGGVGTTIQVLEPGQPVNSFYVCRQYFDPSTGKPVEGKYYYANSDSTFTSPAGSDACDARGLVPDHSPAPTWILGHTSYFTYGHWDLSFTLRAYLGNHVYNNVASSTGYYNAVSNGGSPSNMSTSVLSTAFVMPRYLSSVYVQDASFLRMDNITLGYAFTYKGQPMRVYGTVQNAFTITGYGGTDPAAAWSGIDSDLYPPSRTLTGGLSVRL